MTIEDSAFGGCDSLQSVTIGKSVKSIANSAFGTLIADCTELTSIDVEDGNEHYVSVDGVLFDADKTTVIKYPSNKPEESYTIADSVEKVEEDALLSDNLKKIYIGSGVKEIDWIQYLNNLECIEVSPDNPYYCSISGALYTKNGDELLKYPPCKK